MPAPVKTYYSIVEASAKWGRGVREIIDWSAGGKINIFTFIQYAVTPEGPIAGAVEISAQDMLAHFRIDGPAQRELRVYRVGKESDGTTEWVFASDETGKAGIPITLHDIHITGDDLLTFQEEYELGEAIREKVVYRKAATERHDWESMYRQLCKRIFDSGLPEHLRELASEMQEWFIMQSDDGDAPDLSTIRKRLQPIWNDLREAG